MSREWVFDFHKGWDWKSLFSLGVSVYILRARFVSVSLQVLGGYIAFEWNKQ